MRCTDCGESWFVPPPEAIEELSASARIDDDAPTKRQSKASRLKVRIEDDDQAASGRPAASKSKKPPSRAKPSKSAAVDDDEDDDILFETPIMKATRKSKAARKAAPTSRPAKAAREEDDAPVEKGWKKGKQFLVEDDEGDEDDEPRRSFFSRKGTSRKNEQAAAARRDAMRFSDEEDDDLYTDRYDADYDGDDRDDGQDDDYIAGEARIVDADWEDVGDEPALERGFGRRVRAERRRATAVARLEDVRRFDPDMFDDEFFASLRVTPRELEKALRKARRRAEYRDKNRMTPLRAFGWSAWVAAVAGTLYAVVAYRDEIVKIAPSAAEAYAVVGIEASPHGLAIENVRHRLAMSTGGPMIEITGELKNVGQTAMTAPLLQAEALGPRGELLSRWTFAPESADVLIGGAVAFTTRAPAPEGVAEVALTIAPSKSVAAPGGKP